MKASELLLPEKEIEKLPYSLRTVADAASLHTAKTILKFLDDAMIETKYYNKLERMVKELEGR